MSIDKKPSASASRGYRWRYTIARRFVQLAILGLFIGTARLGWTLFGEPLLSGDFSSSLLLGLIPLSDPFAVLQKLCAGHTPELTMIAGSLIVLAVWIVLGGRSFCAWMCPMNLVTDLADQLRTWLGIKSDMLRIHQNARYAVAVGALAASAVSGTAAFEWVSPQAFLWRELVWGLGWGCASAVLGVFALDLLGMRRGWCGHLCPLGAFWSTVGKAGIIRPMFDASKCDKCAKCIRICPEPHVMGLKDAAEHGFVKSGACLNCGRCIAVCPQDAIQFGLRFNAKPNQTFMNSNQGERNA
ncbi:MAG: quinol dehydrogenase ferredoxin subunit NapH [Duodenibacillus sp.]|nr:quinol dehydrogenase ferredoxin subunit NapH [Duodenibacillus sp.]